MGNIVPLRAFMANHFLEADMYSIRCAERLLQLDHPLVMGIVNITPDSFAVHCSSCSEAEVMATVARMRQAGVDIVDVGGYSTRPHAPAVSEEEEWRRVSTALRAIRATWQEAVVSVDTFRSGIAEKAVNEYGVQIINDVSGGLWDNDMFATVARLQVAYVLTHTRWLTPDQQLSEPEEDVVSEVLHFLQDNLDRLRRMGVADVVIDPGFGLGKSVEENYRMLRELEVFQTLHCPVLAGISRKSMLFKPLQITPDKALNATTAANMLALERGANILRVHDVEEARQAIQIYQMTCCV